MLFKDNDMKPIYVQLAEWLESEILNHHLKEEERIYSQYQLADMFNINPATAAKGLNILAEEDTVYKKRGLGMFVSPNAREAILAKRKKQTLKRMIDDLIAESRRLAVGEKELTELIKTAGREWEERQR